MALVCRLILIAAFVPGLATAAVAASYLGLPTPTFPSDLSHRMYAGEPGYQDAGFGPYTHYVDNSAANCRDDGEGTAARPRCSLPLSAEAGAVIEVHGGPYSDREYPARTRVVTLNGSSTKPVFLRGVANPGGEQVVFADTWLDLTGDNFFVEDFTLRGTALMVGESRPVQRVVVRRITVSENVSRNGVNLYGDSIILSDSYIHHNYGDDLHGVFVGRGSERIWVLDNDLSYNGGDGIQFCHRCVVSPPRYVYIGGNNIYSNRENGVDLKYSRNVVVSQNRIYKHRNAPKNENWCFDDNSYCGVFSSGSDGSSIVVGSDGGPIDVVIVFNDIFNSNNAIRIEEGEDVVVANNLLYNLETSALVLERRGGSVSFVNNTMYDMRSGVRYKRKAQYDLRVANNLFSDIEDPLFILESGPARQISLEHNLFWSGGRAISLRWGNDRSALTGADINRLDGQVKSGNIVADPALGSSGDPALPGSSSPAVDAANDDLLGLNAGFRSRYPGAPSILLGYRGVQRSGCDIDIGAMEVNCGSPSEGPLTGAGGPGDQDPPDNSGSTADVPNDPPDDPTDDPPGGTPDTVITEGDTLVVRAERHYQPDYAVDFAATLLPRRQLLIPDVLPVTEGQPGKRWASLTLKDGNSSTVCFYRGDGKSNKTNPPCSRPNGSVYSFQYCVPESVYESSKCGVNPQKSSCSKAASERFFPYATTSVDALSLSLTGGDSCGTTVVQTVLSGDGAPAPPMPSDNSGDPSSSGNGNGNGSGDAINEDRLTVRAERRYDPPLGLDFDSSFAPDRSIVIPERLPVIDGYPGKNWALLTVNAGGGREFCFYRGDGKSRRTNAPCSRANGSAYVFQYCVSEAVYVSEDCAANPQKSTCSKEASPLVPSVDLRVSGLSLAVVSGDSCGATAVQADF